jgi:PTH2 family peptidyl-tRNA hydrolase
MFKQVIVVRTDLEMGKGKLATQCAHASIMSFLETQKREPDWAKMWLKEGQKKVVLQVKSKQALDDLYAEVRPHFPASLVVDAGHTQLEPGTLTALGIGPAPEPEIDRYTSKYRLL